MSGCITSATTLATRTHVPYTFTLVFKSGAVAVLQVHGAEDQQEARAFAKSVLQRVSYEVRDGETTSSRACVFYSWVCMGVELYALLIRGRLHGSTY